MVGGKPLRNIFEMIIHAKEYDYMSVFHESKQLKEKGIFYLHKLFYHNIDEKIGGRYHDVSVFIF